MRRRPGNPPAAGSNPNLLLAPEDASSGSWEPSSATVTTNSGGDPAYPTADQVAFSGFGSGSLSQVTTTAASSGASHSTIVALPATAARYQATATLDGKPYTYSAVVWSATDVGSAIGLQVSIAGGFIKVTVYDSDGADPTFFIAEQKLEQAATFSQYP